MSGDSAGSGRNPEVAGDQPAVPSLQAGQVVPAVAPGPPDVAEPALPPDPPSEAAQGLARALLGAPLTMDREQVGMALGVSPEEVSGIWRALGFADVGPEQAFAATDVEAIGMLLGFVRVGILDSVSALDLLRSIAQTSARLADWQVETLARAVAPLPPGHPPRRQSDLWRAGTSGPLSVPATPPQLLGAAPPAYPAAADLAPPPGSAPDNPAELVAARVEQSLPALERLLTHVWRRQLFAVVERMTREPGGVSTATQCVGFADIAGFTRIVRSATPADLSALVSDFETGAADVVAACGARLIKTVGDEVMFAADQPRAAAMVALGLHRRHASGSGRPAIRIGLATGEPVMQMGDIYGDPVNLASRLTAAARPGSTLVDSQTAVALSHPDPEHPDAPRFRLRPLAPRRFRGFGLVRAYSLTGGGTPA